MLKRSLVAEIQQALADAGHKISQTEISRAFPSECRGKYCPELYGVWLNRHNTQSVMAAIYSRRKATERPPTPESKSEPLPSVQVIEDRGFCTCWYGSRDPGQGASHCPICDGERLHY